MFVRKKKKKLLETHRYSIVDIVHNKNNLLRSLKLHYKMIQDNIEKSRMVL
jgi:hypothetical protein